MQTNSYPREIEVRNIIILLLATAWIKGNAQSAESVVKVNNGFYSGFHKPILEEFSMLDSISRELVDGNGTLLVKFQVNRLGAFNIEFLSDGPDFIKTAVTKTLTRYSVIEFSPFYQFGEKTIFILPIKFYYKAAYKRRTAADLLKSIPDFNTSEVKQDPDYFQRINMSKSSKLGRFVYLLTPLAVYQPVIFRN